MSNCTTPDLAVHIQRSLDSAAALVSAYGLCGPAFPIHFDHPPAPQKPYYCYADQDGYRFSYWGRSESECFTICTPDLDELTCIIIHEFLLMQSGRYVEQVFGTRDSSAHQRMVCDAFVLDVMTAMGEPYRSWVLEETAYHLALHPYHQPYEALSPDRRRQASLPHRIAGKLV